MDIGNSEIQEFRIETETETGNIEYHYGIVDWMTVIADPGPGTGMGVGVKAFDGWRSPTPAETPLIEVSIFPSIHPLWLGCTGITSASTS